MSKYCFDIETSPENQLDVIKDGKYSPNPIKEKILCICLLNIDTGVITSHSGSEAMILSSFWQHVNKENKFYGFNSNSFDLQYILIRSFINNVKISSDYNINNFIDMRNFLYPVNSFMKGTLRELLLNFGIAAKTNNGSEIFNLYKLNMIDEIIKHCAEDCELSKVLYNKLVELGFIKNL